MVLGNKWYPTGLTYIFPEAIVGIVGLYFISPLLVPGDATALYVAVVGVDCLRPRRYIKAIRPPTIPTKASPPTTPPTIAPTFDFLLVAATGAEVEVGVEVTSAFEELVAWGTGDDSGPPEAKISVCRPIITSMNVPALSAAVTLKELLAWFLNYIQRTFHWEAWKASYHYIQISIMRDHNRRWNGI
jgi:hypothetical protein